MPTALVTGASSGIGEAFARRLAADGYQVVVVARRRERLEALQKAGAAHEVIAADLASVDGCGEVERRLAAGGIDLLVNNAGLGTGASFEDSSLEREQHLLDVNVRAVMRLTHAAVAPMLAAGSGEIVNVSSIAAFTAVAGFASYAASKAYVLALSEGLAVRYAGRGVRVMALCPGYVRSEMHAPEETPTTGLSARLLWRDADSLVDAALRDLRRGRVVSMPGAPYKVAVAATKLLPRRVMAAAGRFANRSDH